MRAGRSGGRRRFGPRDVVYFRLLNELPVGLDRRPRRELFELLATNKDRSGRWRRETRSLVLEGQVEVTLAMDEVERRVEQRVGTFLRGRAKVVSRSDVLGGEPVFEDTRISVRFVGERARNGRAARLRSSLARKARSGTALAAPDGA